MSTPALRSEQIYVSRSTRSGLEFLALMHTAAQPEGTDGPCIGPTADAIADDILRDALANVPQLQAKRRDVHKALAAIDAKYAQEQP